MPYVIAVLIGYDLPCFLKDTVILRYLKVGHQTGLRYQGSCG